MRVTELFDRIYHELFNGIALVHFQLNFIERSQFLFLPPAVSNHFFINIFFYIGISYEKGNCLSLRNTM